MENNKEKLPQVIDTTVIVQQPMDGKVYTHNRELGSINWNSEMFKDALYLVPGQESGPMKGVDVRDYLIANNIPILNSTVLAFLTDHEDLIPDEWKEKIVVFWGTEYSFTGRDFGVKALKWEHDRWNVVIVELSDTSLDKNVLAAYKPN